MRLVVILFGMLAVQPASALDCSQGGITQTDMNQCASRDFLSSDAKLDAVYRKILACLGSSDGPAKPLIEAQRAWLHFRDAECKFQGSASEGGSVQPMVVGMCLRSVTEERIKRLDYYLSCQEGDVSCPTPGCKDR